MKQFLRIFTEILLLFNALTALYGGALLIADPTGGLLEMPLSMLSGSLFKNFLTPGIFLFATIGLFSLLLYLAMFIKKETYPTLIMAQGAIIEAWLAVQVLSIPYRHFLQLVYCSIGFLLIAIGLIQMRLHDRNKRSHKLALP